MSRDEDKLIRQLSLLSFLLSSPRPFTARDIQESVEGYADMSDETFARRFHGDRSALKKIGIEIRVLPAPESGGTVEGQLYLLQQEDFRLPGVEFTQAEVRALSLALAALDGRFAYARPLRLALTAILGGQTDIMRDELERLPVALAADEDARRAGKQLSRLEEAVSRGKTVCFSYPAGDGDLQERKVDPFSLFLIQGRWYVVGHDHVRQAIRTFRVARIQGQVRFLTEKTRDFSVPADYRPEEYRARPPWLIGSVQGNATLLVGEELAWWVKRLQPHVKWLRDDEDGCACFSVPFADQRVLLSWTVGLGGCAELLEPQELRATLRRRLLDVVDGHEGPGAGGGAGRCPGMPGAQGQRSRSEAATDTEDKVAPIAPEHLARAITLLCYLLEEDRPTLVAWEDLERDLGLARDEVEADLSLINLVNFGGGTYALTAEATSHGVRVTRDVMADSFSEPARLSPVMARALLLALELLGDTLPLEGLESLASIREKVRGLVGTDAADNSVFVDEMLPPDPEVVAIVNHAMRDHLLVAIDYFTTVRHELSERLVEPYLLFHSPDGWYLEAFCLKAGGQRTFKLERIRAARATQTPFTPRPEIDLTRRRNGQAFSPDDAAAWALVRFQPSWRMYLEERVGGCWVRPDGEVEVWMPYLDEQWIAQEVIRFLGEAVLEQPASARTRVREQAAALAARYAAETAAANCIDGGGG